MTDEELQQHPFAIARRRWLSIAKTCLWLPVPIAILLVVLVSQGWLPAALGERDIFSAICATPLLVSAGAALMAGRAYRMLVDDLKRRPLGTR